MKTNQQETKQLFESSEKFMKAVLLALFNEAGDEITSADFDRLNNDEFKKDFNILFLRYVRSPD